MDEAQAVRDFLELAKGPVSVQEIEKETGVEHRRGVLDQLVRNGVLREFWALAPGRPGKPFKEYGLSENINAILRTVFQYLTETPKRIEQLAEESGHKLTYKKDTHYALTFLVDHGEVMPFFDLNPRADCKVCRYLEYCKEQHRKGERKPLNAAVCNGFISTWEEKKNA
jgi:hypothetical protein